MRRFFGQDVEHERFKRGSMDFQPLKHLCGVPASSFHGRFAEYTYVASGGNSKCFWSH
jgi:hypothetical protein